MSFQRLLLKGIRNPRRAASAALHGLLAPFGHTRFRRFIVLSRSRTGSNLLISQLGNHPHIHTTGEIFSWLKGRSHTQVLNTVFQRQPFYVKAAGFKIFYYHPQDDDSGCVWNALESRDDLHVIHLTRKNILRTLVSRKLAGTQGAWVSGRAGGAASPSVVSFTPDELWKGFTETRRWEQDGEHRFRRHPRMTLRYEDMVGSPDRAFGQVTDFLGVRFQRPETRLRKQNTRSLRESIANYEELKAGFAGTEWQPFFED
jgi:hypothetical protein